MTKTFKAYVVRETPDGVHATVEHKSMEDLPKNEVLIKVAYSGLNYKDALSASGHRGITKSYPHTPGIDAAGTVIHSGVSNILEGQEVIVTSYDLGMNTSGGFAQYIQVPADWIVPLPASLSLRESMIFGTAGLTAAQGIYAMQRNGQRPDMGPVLVTGARGGVGSFALLLLKKLGYEVIAAVSELGDDTDFLKSLGADDIVDAATTLDTSKKPLLRPRWAGAIDVVGGETLATLLKSTSYGGNVVCIGNIGGIELHTTVFPFILNGINLLGVGTQDTSMDLRIQLWDLLADAWKPSSLDRVVTEIGLEDLHSYLKIMMAKKSRGRVLLHLF